VSMRLRNKIPLFYLQYFPCNSNLCYYPKTLLPLGTHHGSRSKDIDMNITFAGYAYSKNQFTPQQNAANTFNFNKAATTQQGDTFSLSNSQAEIQFGKRETEEEKAARKAAAKTLGKLIQQSSLSTPEALRERRIGRKIRKAVEKNAGS
ncbi:MAG: hypothetical protein VKJ04_07960, partial [Vampirovibrionales bacterium]|nr:hypothetical protein [Vampirovibrionales bacterium]